MKTEEFGGRPYVGQKYESSLAMAARIGLTVISIELDQDGVWVCAAQYPTSQAAEELPYGHGPTPGDALDDMLQSDKIKNQCGNVKVTYDDGEEAMIECVLYLGHPGNHMDEDESLYDRSGA